MVKPWFKSTAIMGGIATALGYIARPENLDILRALPMDEKTRTTATNVVAAAGFALAIFGLRRATPDATIIPLPAGNVAVHDPSGVLVGALNQPRNVYGETALEEQARISAMDAKGRELEETLRARESGKPIG